MTRDQITRTETRGTLTDGESNREWCHEIIEEISSTYATTVDFLNEPLATHTCVAYLLCRIADTIEDAPKLSAEQKTGLLSQYRTALTSCESDEVYAFTTKAISERPSDPLEPVHWRLVARTDRVLGAYRATPDPIRAGIEPAVDELVYGMRKYCGRDGTRSGVRIRTLPDLRRYCYFVAGTVSHVITNVFSTAANTEPSSELRACGEKYGLFLQLMNISKNVYHDCRFVRNVFVPESILDRYGVDQSGLLRADNRSAVESAIEDVAREARSHVPKARQSLLLLPRTGESVFTAWAFPYLLSIAILRELETDPGATLEPGGIDIERAEIRALIEAVDAADPASLESLERTIHQRPLHTTDWPS
jgi:farnesyl-diphosphate farnesyltransferase